jgi:hypothetical protein
VTFPHAGTSDAFVGRSFGQSERGNNNSLAVLWRSSTPATRFILVCTGLLVFDFIIGVVSFGHCVDAGDTCSTANEWTDSVTLAIAVLLIGLIACALVLEAVSVAQT